MKSTKCCKACGRTVGKRVRRPVLWPDGTFRAAMVCRACASRAASIVVAAAPPKSLRIDGLEQLKRLRASLHVQRQTARDAHDRELEQREKATDTKDHHQMNAFFHDGRSVAFDTAIHMVDVVLEGRTL